MVRTDFPPLTLTAYRAQMITVPAGTFWRGSEDFENEKPPKEIYLSEFHIGIVPVTVGLWQEYCVASGQEMPLAPAEGVWGGDWETVQTHPMVNVSWFAASAFAHWAGLRLPTEAQWEKAARGIDGRIFPWGNGWDANKCANRTNRSSGTVPVGDYPEGVSPYGVQDMSGNVWEWCEDRSLRDGYALVADTDPIGPPKGYHRVVRGGAWSTSDPVYFRCANRNRSHPKAASFALGFRLVFSEPERDSHSLR